MTPIHPLLAEVYLAVQQAELRAEAWRCDHGKHETGTLDMDALDDHQVAVAGDLADALDNMRSGLGLRFMRALYPHLDFKDIPEVQALHTFLSLPDHGAQGPAQPAQPL